jgi:hypothetical protein
MLRMAELIGCNDGGADKSTRQRDNRQNVKPVGNYGLAL